MTAAQQNLELTEKRMICTVRSLALTANYVGLADGKFDEKEKEDAKSSSAIFSNWDTLFYMDSEDADEDKLRATISEDIDSIASSGESPATMLDELKKQHEIALTLNKYPEIVPKEEGGTADFQEDASTYTSRDALKKIIKAEDLDVDENDCKDDDCEDGFDLSRFHDLVLAELNSEPFACQLRGVLAIFGIAVATASGGVLGFGKKRSKKEIQAIYDIEESWNGSQISADMAMTFYDMRVEMAKNLTKAIRRML